MVFFFKSASKVWYLFEKYAGDRRCRENAGRDGDDCLDDLVEAFIPTKAWGRREAASSSHVASNKKSQKGRKNDKIYFIMRNRIWLSQSDFSTISLGF
jgi:hypothetical protein